MCEKRFGKFSDLERHIKDKHENYEGQNCDMCGKTFVTAWRLKKHKQIHVEKFTKSCKYFKGNIECPFEELGCKFLHDVDIEDISDKNCENEENKSIDYSSESERSFQTSTPKSDRCEECMDRSECTDCIVRHVLGNHDKRRKLNF